MLLILSPPIDALPNKQWVSPPWATTIPWWRSLHVPMTPRSSILGGFYAPGRVTHGKKVRGGARQRVAQKTLMMNKINGFPCPLPGRGSPGPPPWSQAWGWGSGASAWWPGLYQWGPAGHSPKRLRGTPFPPAHHQQEGPKGSGAVRAGRQPKAGTLAVWSSAAEASSRDVEHHLSGGEGAWAGARGWEFPARYSRPHLDA